jgi:carbamoyl-phosphate synthase large subunit
MTTHDEEDFEGHVSTPPRPSASSTSPRRCAVAGVEERVFELTASIDRWFLNRIQDIVKRRGRDLPSRPGRLDHEHMMAAKQLGFSDVQIGHLTGQSEDVVRALREIVGVRPLLKTVDTCAGEFAARTSYHYFTYEEGGATEFHQAAKPRVVILSAGPNRIGQGIEFDYCCVHAAYALAAKGYETVMVNCNPETVSTDYDTSDRLYFEPLTFEDVMNVIEAEKPEGVIVTLGGQTPINLAKRLKAAGVPIMGTQPEAIDLAEDRDRFASLLDRLDIAYPPIVDGGDPGRRPRTSPSTSATRCWSVRATCSAGRGMAIVYDDPDLEKYMLEATKVSPDHPVYLDSFLEDAIELDVDALCDGRGVLRGRGPRAHRGVRHPLRRLRLLLPALLALRLAHRPHPRDHAKDLALSCHIKGPLNVQYAVKDEQIFVIELNPRASRTVPFSSKATGVSSGQVRCPHHERREDPRPRSASRRPRVWLLRCQGGRHALEPVPRAPTSPSGPR